MKRLPVISFFLASILLSFLIGILVEKNKLFPSTILTNSFKTARVLLKNVPHETKGRFERFSTLEPSVVRKHRFQSFDVSDMRNGVLVHGGMKQFLDHCSGSGCIAVEYNRDFTVKHAYPYKPKKIYSKRNIQNGEYEKIAFDFARDAYPVGFRKYSNGDLLVTFQYKNTYPYGGGVARLDRDGNPVWFREDYSHHWPTIIDRQLVLVPSTTIEKKGYIVNSHTNHYPLNCEGAIYNDTITIIDKDGNKLKELSVLDSINDSHYSHILLDTTDKCDPIHLNHIVQLPKINDLILTHKSKIDSGDYIVSLRNISAFALLDSDGKLKELFQGTFTQQHSVRHFRGSQFLMFDNQGASSDERKVSRLLRFDISDGSEETLFPLSGKHDEYLEMYSEHAGYIDISPDRKRVWISFSDQGRAVEIDIETGNVLNSFFSVHDVSDVDQLPIEREIFAAIYRLYGVSYVGD